jgi:acyl carrier protein
MTSSRAAGPGERQPREEDIDTDIKHEVRQFIADNFLMGGTADMPDDASFMERHVIDSTGFLELIAFLEKSYGVKVKDAEMLPENLDSLDAIDRYVRRKRAAGAGAP